LTAASGKFTPIARQLAHAWGGPVGSARIRVTADDFQVFEVPLVTPCGEGEHCWLKVRKRNSNTQWVAGQLARFAGVSASAVSYAGLKDRHAVAEQWFSVQLPGQAGPDWTHLQHAEFEVLAASRHNRKLKTGALLGNRFRLCLRAVSADSAALRERLQQIAAGGFPNYFGEQRFGHQDGNLEQAARLLQQPQRRMPRAKRGLYLSAVRAALFNRVLAARVAAGSWNQAMPGEALQLDGKSACFVADIPDNAIQQRLAALELHPTGPLCGDGEPLCRGAARAFEEEQLHSCQAWIDGLRRARLAVARRALRVIPRDLHWETAADDTWWLEFYLPAGSYATSLLSAVLDIGAAP
jgi:tRNA pseudouridine13 synthase